MDQEMATFLKKIRKFVLFVFKLVYFNYLFISYKQRRLLSVFVVIGLLMFYQNTRFVNKRKTAEIFNVHNIPAKLYNDAFKSYSHIKYRFKTNQDLANREIKVIQPDKRIGSTRKATYLILEHTKIFSQTKFCQYYDEKTTRPGVIMPSCPFQNCIFTCDKSEIVNSDAVLFHEYDLVRKIDDDDRYMRRAIKYRNENTVWILWNDEPMYVEKYIDKYKFNWTMSYRYDAEIADCSYGCIYRNYPEVLEDKHVFRDQISKEFSVRKNQSLWLVSNCLSRYRTEFAIELRKHYPVLIDGTCRNVIEVTQANSISFGSFAYKIINYWYLAYTSIFTDTRSKCKRNTLCELDQMLQNKFYLSFESRNTSYYITEKFWRALDRGLIPVVIQPQKLFYESIAPPNSFIHAEDFNYDAERLGAYLHSVSADLNLYSKYFEWKLYYKIMYSAQQVEARRLCELCTQLNLESSSIYYESVSTWFNKD